MKNIINYLLAVLVFLGVASCDFETETYQFIPTEDAFQTIEDVQNGMIGTYNSLGSYQFNGNYVIAIGDLSADISVADPSTGHGLTINRYTLTETDAYLTDAWEYGFKTIDRALRTINGAKGIIAENSNLLDEELEQLNAYMAQCYAIKALSNFYFVNLFGLPYKAGGNNTQLGLPLVKDEPIEAFVNIERASIEDTYALIVADLASAKECATKAGSALRSYSQFYMNEAAIYALDARVNLYMGKYNDAKTSAEKAIQLRGTTTEKDDEKYVEMWSDIAITPEDIFTISKTTDDNLSANALNTLYGSYGSTLNVNILAKFGANDIRRGLISSTNRPLKFDGIPSAQAVNNIPVFRISEMYLIIAEVEARNNVIPAAKQALFEVAFRNPDLTIDDLPANSADLLSFISDERVREFFEEGYRWYDIRRTGELINPNVTGVTSFDASKFVFPIPADEINAGFGVVQNPEWNKTRPQDQASL